MKVFAATVCSYGVNAKLYSQRKELKLSGLGITKSKSELNLKAQFLELLISQICRNYFQAMIFSLNKLLLHLVIDTVVFLHIFEDGSRNTAPSGMDFIVTLVEYFDSLTAVMESSVPPVVGFLYLPWVMFTYFLCFDR